MTKNLMLILLLSVLAVAAVDASEIKQVHTPAGLIEVQGGTVLLSGQAIYSDGSVKLYDFAQAGVLVQGNHGGKHCPYSYHLIDRQSGQLKMLNPDADRQTLFGECRRLVEVVPDLGLVIMAPSKPSEQARIFAWNGKAMTETVVQRARAGAEVLGGGESVRRWIGAYLFDYVKDVDERQRLLGIMSEDDLQTFAFSILRGSPMIEKDGYVLGYGCEPDLCNANWAALALSIADGKPYVLMADDVTAQPKGQTLPKLLYDYAESQR